MNGETLEADKIFIDVGARAFLPPIPGLEGVDCLTNSSMMEVDFLPEHLIIVGGSYIGLEFGQMYRRFGSEVTIIEQAPRLIARDDEDVSEAVREILEHEGVNIRLEAECIRVEKRSEQVAVKLDCGSGPREVVGSHLLTAVGRRPNTDDLGLERTEIEVMVAELRSAKMDLHVADADRERLRMMMLRSPRLFDAPLAAR